MPKKLFNAINPGKRNKIFAAALGEFSGYVYGEASINRIIKQADISRGSFYQYFDDKEDLYFYLVEQILRQRVAIMVERLKRTASLNGVALYEEFFLLMLTMLSNPACKDFFRNFYISMTYGFSEKLREMICSISSETENNDDSDKQTGIKTHENASRMLWLITCDLLAEKAVNDIANEYVFREYAARKSMLAQYI